MNQQTPEKSVSEQPVERHPRRIAAWNKTKKILERTFHPFAGRGGLPGSIGTIDTWLPREKDSESE